MPHPPGYGHHGSLRRLAIGLAEAGTSHFFAISGRTDLRKGVSEAKFDGQADFDVKKCLGPPKSVENREKPEKNPKKIPKKFFRRQKIESCKLSETRFPEVSRRLEPSSKGERTLEVRIFMVKNVFHFFD